MPYRKRILKLYSDAELGTGTRSLVSNMQKCEFNFFFIGYMRLYAILISNFATKVEYHRDGSEGRDEGNAKGITSNLLRLSADLEGMFSYTCSFRLQISFGSCKHMMLEALPRWALLLQPPCLMKFKFPMHTFISI
jgi:hypothetical protein